MLRGIPIDDEMLLVTDFMSLKIKSVQYFRGDHKGRVCVLIEVSARIFMNICVYTIFLDDTTNIHPDRGSNNCDGSRGWT
jgi:hypothetical protein